MGQAELTDRQRQVYDFIVRHHKIHQRPPTQAEIARALKSRGRSGVIKHLRRLEEEGLIGLARGKSRGITMIVHRRGEEITVPILGAVRRTGPMDVMENVCGDLTLSSNAFREPPDFLIRVADSMNLDWGMEIGDLVAVKAASSAAADNLVLLRQEGSPQFQKLMHDGAQWWLVPGRREGGWMPYRVKPRSIRIAGIYLGLIRNHPGPSEISSGLTMWLL